MVLECAGHDFRRGRGTAVDQDDHRGAIENVTRLGVVFVMRVVDSAFGVNQFTLVDEQV